MAQRVAAATFEHVLLEDFQSFFVPQKEVLYMIYVVKDQL